MVNVISIEKARAFRHKTFAVNIRHMQEKVAAMKASDSAREDKSSLLSKQDKVKSGERI